MACKLLQHPVPTSQAIPSIPMIRKIITAQKLAPAMQSTTKSIRLFGPQSGLKHILKNTTKVAEDSCSLVNDDMEVEEKGEEPLQNRTPDLIKTNFHQAIKGINGGIFGVQSARKSEIERLVALLQTQNPTPDPALHLEKVGGCWKLVYGTKTILGARRTKLGLRHFLTLGDIYQTIDVAKV
ncbi:Plastid lipid-associated protein/fibrillin conserved domain - like 3 [Theobroma cacao]|nr:Plastid lipid-associated protein/fibrillin conserved domain - like 3 [Theobroma cacao]